MSIESVSGPLSPHESPLARKIERHLDNLPGQLRKTWQARYDDLSDEELPQFERELDEFAGKRSKALIGTAAPMFGGMHHLVNNYDEIERTLAVIREAEGNPELFVGDGKTGHVYRDPYTKAICYKYVHNFAEYEAWNSVDSEAKFLEELEDMEVEGVRVPKLNGVIDLPDTKVIAMEFLDAPSIDKIIDRNKLLPAGFDLKIFMGKLRAYVEAMHARDVYHRDLHTGNVLVGANNAAYIIDFGRAVHSPNADFAYETYDRTHTNKIVLNSDEQWLYALETQLQRYLLDRSKLALKA